MGRWAVFRVGMGEFRVTLCHDWPDGKIRVRLMPFVANQYVVPGTSRNKLSKFYNISMSFVHVDPPALLCFHYFKCSGRSSSVDNISNISNYIDYILSKACHPDPPSGFSATTK